MSSVRQLIVDGIAIPVYAMVQISQRYEADQAVWRPRMRSGARKQRIIGDKKIRTIISGNGLIPVGISGVDYDSSFTLSCVGHRSILSASTSIALPAARRSDAGSEPFGRALVGDKWVSTPVSMVSDTANLTPVSGATQYQAVYFPEIVVFADPPFEDKPDHGPTYAWTLTAQEV